MALSLQGAHEAIESGLDVDVRFTDTSGWFSNYRIGETTGATKILVDKSTDRIIGAHLLGHDYAELANTIALAMKQGLTTHQIKSTTAAYPSTGSVILSGEPPGVALRERNSSVAGGAICEAPEDSYHCEAGGDSGCCGRFDVGTHRRSRHVREACARVLYGRCNR